jgi:hypothetical protein
MSKKRYDELTKLLNAEIDDEERVKGILKGFCEIMKYDPEAKTVHKKPCVYDAKQASNIKNYRDQSLIFSNILAKRYKWVLHKKMNDFTKKTRTVWIEI